MAVKKFNEYTRSELEAVRDVLMKQADELTSHLGIGDYPKLVREAMETSLSEKMDVVGKINSRLKTLVSKCIFCKEPSEVEVPTITHICGECDTRIFGRRV